MILISGSQTYEFKDRNASPKPSKKHTHFNPDLTEADMTAHTLVTKAMPTSGTSLLSKPHTRKKIMPSRRLAESSTIPSPPTYRYSAAEAKPNDGKLSKMSRTKSGYLPARMNTVNDLAFVRNLSRNIRESAPSPEPSPPLGMKEKGGRTVVKNVAASSTLSTVLNTRSHALRSKKETKQHTEGLPTKSVRSKGKTDIARPFAANKIMTAKAFPKTKYAPSVAESRETKVKASKPNATPEVVKSNLHPKAAAPLTGKITVMQPTAIVSSISKPKKRSGY